MAIAPAMTTPGESSAAILAAHPRVQRAPFAGLELFQVKRFIPATLCAELIALIDADRQPSTIADSNGDAYFRTSETCHLDPGHPAVIDLEERLFALGRINPAFGEPVQGQRYDMGQEFKPHTDFFDPQGVDWERFCGVAGQRTWTFMVYLNEVAAGGGTRFVEVKKTVHPETGKLLAWNNRLPDGSPNSATLHQGMKVRKGVKYVITKWYRERPWG
jgi:prolyl 4-hydroxylase